MGLGAAGPCEHWASAWPWAALAQPWLHIKSNIDGSCVGKLGCMPASLPQMRRVGTLVKQPVAAEAAAAALERRIAAAVAAVPPREDGERPCVACLEWVSPIFVGG